MKLIIALLLILNLSTAFGQNSFQPEKKWTDEHGNSDKYLVGDFNGDGMDDISYHLTNNDWKVMLSTGDNFSSGVIWTNGQGINNGVWVGDFNGDGLDDKVTHVYSTNAQLKGWWVAYSERDLITNNYKINPEKKWTQELGSANQNENIIGDFNGDGMDDIAFHLPNHQWKIMFSNGSGFNASIIVASGQGINSGVYVGDFNGDGLDDKVSQVYSDDLTWGGWWVALSTPDLNLGGSHFINESRWINDKGSSDGNIIGDFNGDSKDDIAYHMPNHDWKVMLSTGSGFAPAIVWTNGQGVNSAVFSGDFNGDGWIDKLTRSTSNDTYWNGWWVSINKNLTPRQVGLWYYGTYWIEPGFTHPATITNSIGWLSENRDPQKVPIVGWGADTISGVYSCQDTAILRRQFGVMKKIGVDFIMANLTDGVYLNPTTYPELNFQKGNGETYSGDGSSSNAFDFVFEKMKTLPPSQRIPIGISVGFGFWGAIIQQAYFQNYESYSQQIIRQDKSIIEIKSRYLTKYPDIYWKYLGKPFLMPNFDQPFNFPFRDINMNIHPRSVFNDFTVRYGTGWGSTYMEYNTNNIEGIDTKRFWSWGAGAVDIGIRVPNPKPLPKNFEQMSIITGCKAWNADGDPEKIYAGNGDYYINSWKQVLSVMPKIVLIADFNNWNEEAVIEGCRGLNGWKDRKGHNTYDWYLQITQKYSYIFKNDLIPNDTYFRQEGRTPLYYKNNTGGIVIYKSQITSNNDYPDQRADILLPTNWCLNHGVTLPTVKNPPIEALIVNNINLHPNPFNPTTTISFTLVNNSSVSIKVFDLLGREVKEVLNQSMEKGDHHLFFDGSSLSSGVYFYRFQVNDFVKTSKFTILK